MARAPRDASTRSRRSRSTPRWLTTQPDLDQVARNRVLLVLAVLSGETPVTTAIEQAKISRGLYYQLETKALNAMLRALAPGADGDPTPDGSGMTARIRQLEAQVARAEAAQRRAERLLFLARKLTPGPVKTARGRPPKPTTSSTRGGRSDWRSSTTTRSTPARARPKRPRSSPTSSTSATTAAGPTTASTPTPAGASAGPSGGSENSRAPTPRATT